MGEVISIKRSTDDDLYALFNEACPEVPAALDEKIQYAAIRAIGGSHEHSAQLSFKTVCLVVAGACVICLLYTSPSPRDKRQSRMPSSA